MDPNKLVQVARAASQDPDARDRIARLAIRLLPWAVSRGAVNATEKLLEALCALQPLGSRNVEALSALVSFVSRQDHFSDAIRRPLGAARSSTRAAFEFAAHALRLRDLPAESVRLCWQLVAKLSLYVRSNTLVFQVVCWLLEHPNLDKITRRLLFCYSPISVLHELLAACPEARKDPWIVYEIFQSRASPQAMEMIARSIEPDQLENFFTPLLDSPIALRTALGHLGCPIRSLSPELLTKLFQHPDREIRVRALAALDFAPSSDLQPDDVERVFTPESVLRRLNDQGALSHPLLPLPGKCISVSDGLDGDCNVATLTASIQTN